MSRRQAGWLLCLPALALLTLAFLWPMAILARMSLNETSESGMLVETVSTATYVKLAEDAFTWQVTRDSLVLSAGCATSALLLAYPMALFLFRTRSRWRNLLAIAAIAPLLVSGTGRVIGWLAILGDGGMVNAALHAIGLPTQHLINNWTGVRIGLTESVMPYTVLALLAGFGRLDPRLEEAAATLGARPLRAFWRVTFPLTLPAVSAGWLLAFVLAISAFVTPHLMGGGRVFVLATEIYDAATQTLDWPAAAALSIYALVLLLVLMLAHGTLSRRAAA
ncbi:ABC transporter permease [Limobrevibacterium gyesilva]|uniref:ABC transporter permease n=1 Tax=Limobrevibacterium gyesilva TaxID=2991712 RepID=A0AA42CFW1_9PROT|nr:ABC transporter permease [Limobrevibacterium gyesilva]MCW3473210.1 ABC transporter permease [Limobrevibacterium gyesilva]